MYAWEINKVGKASAEVDCMNNRYDHRLDSSFGVLKRFDDTLLSETGMCIIDPSWKA
jgi:hypothetical protein